MRQVRGYPTELRCYVPAAYGNRDATEADRVRVWIRTPTAGEKRALLAKSSRMRVATGDDGQPLHDKDGNLQLEIDLSDADRRHRAILERFVERVENYLDTDGEPIATGADLAEHGEDRFVSEIADEVWLSVSLSAAEGKDCAGSPGSCSAGTSPSLRTAECAGETGGTKAATAGGETNGQTTAA